MANLVQIYNLALARVGHTQRVTLTTERNQHTELCNELYEQCRDQVLRDFPWRFAKRRLALSVLAGTPPDNWLFQYTKPSDCLRLRYLDFPGNRTPLYQNKIPFELASIGDREAIFTDQEEAVLVYTQRIEDTSRFDPLFVAALADLIASELVVPLRGKPDLVNLLLQKYERSVGLAAAASLNEGHDHTPSDSLLEARNG